MGNFKTCASSLLGDTHIQDGSYASGVSLPTGGNCPETGKLRNNSLLIVRRNYETFIVFLMVCVFGRAKDQVFCLSIKSQVSVMMMSKEEKPQQMDCPRPTPPGGKMTTRILKCCRCSNHTLMKGHKDVPSSMFLCPKCKPISQSQRVHSAQVTLYCSILVLI